MTGVNPARLARKRDGVPLAFWEPGPALTLPRVSRRGVEWSTHLRTYADVIEFETNPAFSRAALRPAGHPDHFLFAAPWFVDAPLHSAYRKAASPPFRASRVASYEPLVREAAAKWVEQGTAGDVFDLTGDVLQPFALEVVGRILGAHGDAIPGFWEHLAAVTEDENLNQYPPPGPMGAALDAVIAGAESGALPEFGARLRAVDAPPVFAGRESELERGFGGAAFLAGTDTVAMTVANGFALAQAGDGTWWRTLRLAAADGDDAAVAAVMEEGMRLAPAFPAGAAVPTVDVPLPSGGVARAGRTCVAWFTAANRDPAVFDHPDQVWPGRSGDHLGFGWGPHFCWGAPLARLEIRVIAPMLLKLGIRPAGGRRRVTGRVNRLTPDPYMHGRAVTR